MSTPKLISPLLDNFMMGDPISDINGVRCCPAMHQQTQEKYLVKIISVPANQTKLEALLLTGAYPNAEAAAAYFKQQADEIANEVQILKNLSHNSGFEGFEAYQVVPMDDATGYDVYLLYPYRKTLERHCQNESITHLDASNMALDICAALATCRNQGYIFLNLKPENILLTADKNYRIGDLGLLQLSSLKYASIPERYFSAYTAPELTDAFSEPNETVDTYALGMILYEIYNGGLPFTGDRAPAEVFPAPQYAEGEIAEIILKACAPDPADRWQTPAQMGQALIACIQRNGISDTPIVVLPSEPEIPTEEAPIGEASIEEAPIEEAPEEIPVEETIEEAVEKSIEVEIDIQEEEIEEVPPEEDSEEPEVTEETETFSEAVDEIIEESDGVTTDVTENEEIEEEIIAEEPAEEPEISEKQEEAPEVIEETTSEVEDYENLSFMDADLPEEDNSDDIDAVISQVEALIADDEESEDSEAEAEEDDALILPVEDDAEKIAEPAKKRSKKWIGWVLAAVLFIGLLVGGYFFYTMYYLQPVNLLNITVNKDSVSIHVSSPLDSKELSIVLTDARNEKTTIPLIGNNATINGLQPDMEYTVTVEANSFHKLTGETTATFTTQKQTQVLNLTVVTGSAAGTAELTFQVNGPDSETWTATFQSEDEMFVSIPFSGHSVTFTGLTVGASYNVSISPSEELFLTGTTETTYTATDLIVALDPVFTEFTDDKLTIIWTVPEGVHVESWSVLCNSETGVSQILNVTEPKATFEGVELTSGYTVQITAAGQSVSTQAEIAAGAPTISGLSASASGNNIYVSWSAPEGNWKVRYELVGTDILNEVSCTGKSVTIYNAVPGETYQITVLTSEGVPAAHPVTTVTVPNAGDFAGYTVSRANMQFSMCKTPAKANWSRSDLQDSDYTTTFAIGQKASFLIRLNKTYNTSPDTITSLFVIRDANGKVVHTCSSASTWTNMWYKGYCELDIPSLPEVAGNYQITVYFNGSFVYSGNFNITG